jgi:hypothetical protein
VPATATIDGALEEFLAEQRERLSAKTMRNYDDVVSLLRMSLNSYAYDSLDEPEQERWREAFDAGDEDAFTKLFGPEKIVNHFGEFLGYFMIRKVFASQELLRASGTVTKKLAKWLFERGYISDDDREDAVERAGDAAHQLPRADRLGTLLHEVMERTPPFDRDQVAEGDWIEDFLTIERVEPGELWFEDGIGPVRVPKKASDLAEAGWGVNIVLAKLRGEWRIVELGFVYP